MKTGPGLMLHEDRGEFILMGKQPLKPSSYDFFISHREQEVSQLTGANSANCAMDKRWGAEKKGREKEKAKATTDSSFLLVCVCVCCCCAVNCSPHPVPFFSCRGFYTEETV